MLFIPPADLSLIFSNARKKCNVSEYVRYKRLSKVKSKPASLHLHSIEKHQTFFLLRLAGCRCCQGSRPACPCSPLNLIEEFATSHAFKDFKCRSKCCPETKCAFCVARDEQKAKKYTKAILAVMQKSLFVRSENLQDQITPK